MSHAKTTQPPHQPSQVTQMPETEVVPQTKRGQFYRAYKLRILAEAYASTHPGQIGSLLRREGLY